MAFKDKIMTSILGRRLGLQRLTTALSGGSRGQQEYLVGPEAFRGGVTTGDTTAINIHPFGVALLPGTSAQSSAVYTIDPPVPGVRKTILATTSQGPVYLRTSTDEVFHSSLGSTHNTVKISTLGGAFDLVGVTTAIYALIGVTSGTSSQPSSFALTTST